MKGSGVFGLLPFLQFFHLHGKEVWSLYEEKKIELLKLFNETAPIAKFFGMRLSFDSEGQATLDLPYRDGPIFLYRPERMLSDKGTLHAATRTLGTVLQ